MPLTCAESGERHVIRRIGGDDAVRRHLESLGFVVGGTVTVVSTLGPNLIVNIKDSRIAVDGDLAARVLV